MRHFDIVELWVWWIMFCTAVTIALTLPGCNGEQRLTRPQWLQIMPSDPNRAVAQVIYEEGILIAQQKAKDLAAKHKLEYFLFVILVASIAGLFILAYLKLQMFSFIAVAVMAACAAGIGLLQMDEHYPKLIPFVGGAGMLIFGGAAVYYLVAHRRSLFALKEVVENVEKIKAINSIPNTRVDPDAPHGINNILKQQCSATKSLVAGIRKKL